ncbi:autotransporter outer membrane beta-barrel domain-containing protein [Endozoicomonas atrinae]|uniref:autotransporter family protein n=1 Tax=Endozoicomonas atrinae TaxID=1333660 RepID=UPI000826458A|nr:autotransporter outer membrane beta-barrel domain-containing protein [Endozoicomonas atrinae]
MNAVKTFKPALLAVAVSSVLSGLSGFALATTVTDPTENVVINAGEVIDVVDGSAFVFTTPPTDGTVTITNNGTINASEHAIKVTGGGKTGEIVNSGTIMADQSAIFVDGEGSYIGKTTNKGTIQSANGAAIYVGTGASIGTQLRNEGTIIGGMVDGKQVAVDISRAVPTKFDLNMQSNSKVVGNIHLNGVGVGDITVSLGTEATNVVFDGTHISGVDLINMRRESELTLEAQDETIVFDLVGDSQTAGIFSMAENNKLILKLNGKVGKDSEVLQVNGRVAFGAGSKVTTIALASTDDITEMSGTHTLISADDFYTDTGDVNTKYDVEGNWLIVVDDHRIVEDGDREAIEADLSFNTDANSGDLVDLAKAGGADATEQAMMKAFADIAFDGTEITESTITFARNASQDLMNLLGTATDDAAAARLSGELTPDRSGATIHAIQRVQTKQLDSITDRINGLRADQLSDQGFWFRAHGNTSEKDVSGRIDGYDVDGYGITVGIDTVESENWLAGVAYSQNYQEIDTKVYDTNYVVDSYQIAAYGNWSKDNLFVNSAVNAGYNSFKSERSIGASTGYTGETRATANFSAYNVAMRVTAGMDIGTDDVMIQPMVAGELAWQNIRNYQEEGSPASLAYDDQTMDQVKLGAGVNVNTVIETSSGDFIPSFTAMGWYDFKAEDHDIAGHTIADPSVVGTVTTADGSTETRFELRAGVNYAMKNGTDIGFGLSHDIEDDYQDTQLQLSLNYSF